MASRKHRVNKTRATTTKTSSATQNSLISTTTLAEAVQMPTAQEVFQEIEVALAGVKPKYAQLKVAISKLVDIPATQINPKMFSAANQVSPRASESHTNKSRIEAKEWVFVGLFKTDERLYESMLSSLKRELALFASIGIIFAEEPEWRVLKIYYAPGYEDRVERLRAAFSIPNGYTEVLNVRATASVSSSTGGMLAQPAEESNANHPEKPKAEEPSSFSIKDAIRELFISEEEFNKLLALFERKRNLILQGPPGVGKSFIAKRLAYSLIGSSSPDQVTMIQFHQGYSYEDFIQGWRPKDEGGFELKSGIFYLFCNERAGKAGTDIKYVFIIDEINRGNLSKIFGELMFLIEPDKRGPNFAIPLMYSKDDNDTFYVPENVYVLGLMNTADRSLAMVDYALRRRFAFYDLKPAFGEEAFTDYLLAKGVPAEIVDRINLRMEALNEKISNDKKNLGPGYEIGHSFFCPVDGEQTFDEDWYKQVIESEIAPLLREYWFDESDSVDSSIAGLLA